MFRHTTRTTGDSQRQALGAVHQVGLAASTLALDAVLQQVYEQVRQIIPLNMFCIALYDEVSDELHGELVIEDGEVQDKFTLRASSSEGLMSWVMRSRQTLHIGDLEAERDKLPAQPVRVGASETRSWLGLPLIAQERVVGVMSVQSTRPNAFTADDDHLLQTIAAQAAIAIENSRLYQNLRTSEERYRSLFTSAQRQAQELTLLDRVRTVIARELDLPTVFRTVVEAIAQSFGYSQVSLYLLENALSTGEGVLVLQSQVGYDQFATHIPVSEGICGRVARTGKPVLLQDVRTDPDFIAVVEGLASEVCVPLFDQGQVVGVLNVETTQGTALGDEDLRILTSLSEHIGLAISQARLFSSLAQEKSRLELLYRLARRLSTSLDMRQVAQWALDDIRAVTGASCGSVMVRDAGDRLQLIAFSGHSQSPEWADQQFQPRLGKGLTGWVAAHRQSALVDDVTHDERWVFLPGVDDKTRAAISVPLLSGDELVGVFSIASDEVAFFNQDHLRLVESAATSVAVAIANARLHRESSRRLNEVSLIQAVALAGAAGRPFDDIVYEATRLLGRLWDSHHLGFLFPDETGALRVHPSYQGLSAELKQTLRMQPGQGLTGWVFQQARSVVVPDVRQEPRYMATDATTLSEMDVPLLVGERPIGVVNVESRHPNAFSVSDLQLLSAIAGQLAIVFDNVQAHRELAAYTRQLEEAYDKLAEAEELKDQLVQNISHELRTPITYIMGYTALMLAETFGPLPPALQEPLQTVSQKTEAVSHLIQRIVALQAMTPSTLELEPLALADLIREASENWKYLAQRANIKVHLDLLNQTHPVIGDRKQLLEVFENLFNNAIKFSPRGGQVTVRACDDAEFVHVEIADTGIGIPPDKLTKVFDRFYQIDGSTTRRFGGTGVGLTVVRQIVQAHGGRIWAESAGTGRGATFHLALPTAPMVLSESEALMRVR